MKRALRIGAAVAVLALLVGAGGLLVLRTAWFREQLRQRAIEELQKTTGGKVEIARIDFEPRRWRARLAGLTIRGTEGPGDSPLLHAEALEVQLRLISFLERRVDVAGLRLVAPEIHIRVAADGSTNIPTPPGKSRLFTEDVLDLAVGSFEVERGALWWNDRRYDLEVAMSSLRAQVRLDKRQRYVGHVEAVRAILPPWLRVPMVGHLAADFQLLRDRIEVPDVTVHTGRSMAKASGTISNLFQPHWQFQYEAAVEAPEAAHAIELPELKAGRILVRGKFDAGPGGWGARGTLSGRQVAIAGKGFQLREASLDGEYRLDPRQLRVDDLRVRLLGGEWSGRLKADYPSRSEPIRASAEGRVEGIRLEAVAQALSSPGFSRLGWTAVIRGPVNARGLWPLSARNLSAEADVILEPPGDPGGLTPVRGTLRAAGQGQSAQAQINEFRLATAATSIVASGHVSSESRSDLQFQLQTTRLEDLAGTAAVLSGEKIEIPLRLDGEAAVRGRATGTLEQPEVDANVDVARFAYQGREWDSFSGRVQWSPRRLRLIGGRLAKGRTAVSASLTAELEDGKLTDRSRLEAEIAVRDTQLEDLAALAGQKPPLSGAVTATLKLEGTRKEPRGAGRIEIRRGVVWEEPFDSLRSGVTIDGSQVRLQNVQIAKGGSAITGASAFDLEKRTFRFDAQGQNLALSQVQTLAKLGQDGASRKVAGSASFEASGSGRMAAPAAGSAVEELAIAGDLRLQKVALDGHALGDFAATVRNQGDKLKVEVQSSFAGGQIRGDGEVTPRGAFPVQGRIEFRDLDLAPALQMAGLGNPSARIPTDGSLALSGEARRPETISADGSLTRLEIIVPANPGAGQQRTLRSVEPVKWRVAKQKLTLEALHLAGEGSDLHSSGSVDLGSAGAINLAVKGSLDLEVLARLESKLDVSGSSTVDATITGPLRHPDLRGAMELRKVSVGSDELPVSFSAGEINLSGYADLAGENTAYRLLADARQMRVHYQRGLTALLEGRAVLAGANQRSVLSGDIKVSRVSTRASLDVGVLLAALKQPIRTPSRNPWLSGAQLNVAIVTAPDIRFDTSLARNFQADANLRLQGTALNPALLGRINITQGDFQFQGTHFSIDRGDITFLNPVRIDPILNLDLETSLSGYEITLTLAGPIQQLGVSYRSDPPLPFNEVITLLAVGRAPTTDPTVAAAQSAQARSLTQLGATGVISQAMAKPAAGGRLQRFFGASHLKLDPEMTGAESGNLGARVTLEQQVGKDITFTYTYNLASAQEQIVRVRWALSPQFSVIAVRDENGVFGLDFLYKKRYR